MFGWVWQYECEVWLSEAETVINSVGVWQCEGEVSGVAK
jgi:hypothetical protein